MRKLPVAIATAMKKAGVTKQSKYRAVPTVVDGIRFDSKAEAEYYRRLKVMQENGDIVCFLRQVPFDLPGGYRHRVDFMVVTMPGCNEYETEFIEIKGKDIAAGRMKRKQVRELYGYFGEIKVLRAVYQRGVIVWFEEVES